MVSYKLPEKVSLPSLLGGKCDVDLRILLRPNAFIRKAIVIVTDPLNHKVFEQTVENAVPRMEVPIHTSLTIPPLGIVSRCVGLIVLVALIAGSGFTVRSIRVKRLISAYRRTLLEDVKRIKKVLRNVNEMERSLEAFGGRGFKLKDLMSTVSRGIDRIERDLSEIERKMEKSGKRPEINIVRRDFKKRLSDVNSLINEIRDLRDRLSTSEIRIGEFVEEVLLRVHLIKRRLKVLKAVTRG